MNQPTMSNIRWRKSSHSGSQSGECVEAAAQDETVFVRDSKNPDGPALTLTPGTWHSLLSHIKAN
ncbi:DUF397 domain-containing protein [Actinomadura sp. 9N407]|uniref:DUF397 domain-containing protein n=1 Tax=Actinomadura sp. 9N407 TaxID=3375154 RepID=UPI0037A30B9B